jgi:hypothetical protein
MSFRMRSFIGHAGVVSSTVMSTFGPSTSCRLTIPRVTRSFPRSGSRTVRSASRTRSEVRGMDSPGVKDRGEMDEHRRNVQGRQPKQVRKPRSVGGLIEKFTSVRRRVDHDTSPRALFPRFRGDLPFGATCRAEWRFHWGPQVERSAFVLGIEDAAWQRAPTRGIHRLLRTLWTLWTQLT